MVDYIVVIWVKPKKSSVMCFLTDNYMLSTSLTTVVYLLASTVILIKFFVFVTHLNFPALYDNFFSNWKKNIQ